MIRGAEDIIKNTGCDYARDVSIKNLNTLGIFAVAAYFATPKDTDAAVCLVRSLEAFGIPYFLAGGMSNTLPCTLRYEGVIVNLRKLNRKTVAEHSITAECGARLSSIVRELSKNSLGGCEQLYHIPGTLGGAVCGNAGAHGIEISDVFVRGVFYSIERDATLSVNFDEMGFAYRDSRMKRERLLLLQATLSATDRDPNEVDRLIEHFRKLRKNQPHGVKTLGSTFKKSNGVSAGYYIDRAGLKGAAVGGAYVSPVHAGFIVNRGDATSTDVLRLIEAVKKRVYSVFGIGLEEEIVFLR